jgi:ATP phosphoribosyltransferase regulatory subunit
MDLKAVAALASEPPRRAAIRAEWRDDAAQRAAVRRLRQQGETVVCLLPGHAHEAAEFDCDRELVASAGQWLVRAL